jgi:GTP-binding protein LepA
MDTQFIRNFCIIAHIDHGKSTLADRFLEVTGTVRPKDMKEQFLDQMELERERGITIKGKAVTLNYLHSSGEKYLMNLIDTPGHVDFSYEVSRALAACESAILVVDATQGVQAQTIATTMLALDNDLMIIPVINKIDMPQAQPNLVGEVVSQMFGFSEDEILYASAKNGVGIKEILNAIVERTPPPPGDPTKPLRALVFDSTYNSYKGIVAYTRIFDGTMTNGSKISLMSTDKVTDSLEVGIFNPTPVTVNKLEAGQVGYIATGLKEVRECRVGDTITTPDTPTTDALPGYQPLKPMVFAGIYPADGQDYQELRSALEKLQLNDASLLFDPENSPALGFGFRCGFLGLLHMEIVQERIEREYGLDIVVTAPSVAYQVLLTTGELLELDSPSKLPPNQTIAEIHEPWLDVTIVTPQQFIGGIMELMSSRRGEFQEMEYLQGGLSANSPNKDRVVIKYLLPLAELLAELYDQLKSHSQGYASMDYSFKEYRSGPLSKLDILVNGTPVDALSVIVHREQASNYGRSLVGRLKALIPRQLFDIPIQAAINGRVTSRETVKAVRKDVIAKCYGGDVTRKRKLLERQKEGKKRLKKIGNVEIPQEAFMTLLKM